MRLKALPTGMRSSVQPRVCGECILPLAPGCLDSGSAPRVRGMRRPCPCGPAAWGFSPACAGNAATAASRSSTPDGSAPRVRGMLIGALGCRPFKRFSPACAGNAADKFHRTNLFPVQPRVCGECNRSICRAECSVGSAPRVRGMPGEWWVGFDCGRFSPACAGNAGPAGAGAAHCAVQPRVCGECESAAAAGDDARGSAPRVRGMLGRGRPAVPGRRFSPACAGNASPLLSSGCSLAVQPRVCGECRANPILAALHTGSAPRVRGMRWWIDRARR